MIAADPGGAMRSALRVLAGGGVGGETLLFWMDERAPGGEVRGPSLGRGPRVRGNIPLAVRLARLSGCAVVPGYVTRLPGTRFVTTFLPPVAPPAPTGDARADTAAAAAALDAVLDPVVRERLPQWLHLIGMRWGEDEPPSATPPPPRPSPAGGGGRPSEGR